MMAYTEYIEKVNIGILTGKKWQTHTLCINKIFFSFDNDENGWWKMVDDKTYTNTERNTLNIWKIEFLFFYLLKIKCQIHVCMCFDRVRHITAVANKWWWSWFEMKCLTFWRIWLTQTYILDMLNISACFLIQ